ncbi:uncharacterized protein N7498_005137 [Penicillium cinerascens]|uniref:Protein kinase domain-containing protein n=1 Tax=Penicillium cinerascens TaxID=70096 RepID=A0A9W9SZU6_9EURO|nr:uncharacterized protein N7498_005137 [Penicillium cinerascens]KAJ5204258.1 hypothetical protein N7498_005137 [Penicillium cinerascens]
MKDRPHHKDTWTGIAVHRPDQAAAHHHYLTRPKHSLASQDLNDAPSSNSKRGWPIFGVEHRPSLASMSTDRQPLMRSETCSSMASHQIIPSPQRSFTDKYGRCLEILHYGTNSTVRLHNYRTEGGKLKQLFAVKVYRYNILDASSPVSNSSCDTSSIPNVHPRHPNILSITDLLYNERSELCLVMPYCTGGDLHELLSRNGPLPTPEADCLVAQILRALDFLHQHDTAHRDVRLETVLLTKNGAVKLAGFGDSHVHRIWSECATPREPDDTLPSDRPHPQSSVSWSFSWMLSSFSRSSPPRRASVDTTSSTASFPGMSLPYTSPEAFRSRSRRSPSEDSDEDAHYFDPRPTDVWAAAIIYMTLVTGRLVWRSARPDREDSRYLEYLQGRYAEDGYPPIEALGNRRRNAIYAMLHPNPRRRITTRNMLRSEWMSGVSVCEAGDKGY